MVPPCFTSASRQKPYGVQTYSCALTGAPVAACANVAVSRAAPRPSSPEPSVPVSTVPGSLCRIFLATLLFLAFEGRDSVLLGLHLVYDTALPLSRQHFAQKNRGVRSFPHAPANIQPFLLFFFFAVLRTRLSVRTAIWVPMDWKICTRMTSTTTETQRMICIWR